MLANISVRCDENVNIQEALRMFTAAWKNLSIIMVLNCWHKASILSVRHKIIDTNLTDDDVQDNWQQICQKVNVPAEVMMEDFINVDGDDAIIQEATDDTVNSITERKKQW
jgi:hypothetical protein